MINLKQGTKFNITFFAKKYGKFITRAGLWTEKSKECISKKNETLFTFWDLDRDRYTTASGDITVVERKDN